VIENVSRYLEQGVRPLEAALRGSREIGFTVISMSLSLVAVFLPILLMGGIVGRLFREFAVVLSVAVCMSLVISLTTTPVMCALWPKPTHAAAHGPLYRASERAFAALLAAYERSLAWVLRHARLTLAVALITVGINGWLYAIVPKGFFPEQDNGRLMGAIQADQDTSFQSLREKVDRFASIVMADPAVDTLVGMTGGSFGTTNTGRMFVALKPLSERKISAAQVMA